MVRGAMFGFKRMYCVKHFLGKGIIVDGVLLFLPFPLLLFPSLFLHGFCLIGRKRGQLPSIVSGYFRSIEDRGDVAHVGEHTELRR